MGSRRPRADTLMAHVEPPGGRAGPLEQLPDFFMTGALSLMEDPRCRDGFSPRNLVVEYQEGIRSRKWTEALAALSRFQGGLNCLSMKDAKELGRSAASAMKEAARRVNQQANPAMLQPVCALFNALLNPSILIDDMVACTGGLEIYDNLRDPEVIEAGKRCKEDYPGAQLGFWGYSITSGQMVGTRGFAEISDRAQVPTSTSAVIDLFWERFPNPINRGNCCPLEERVLEGFSCRGEEDCGDGAGGGRPPSTVSGADGMTTLLKVPTGRNGLMSGWMGGVTGPPKERQNVFGVTPSQLHQAACGTADEGGGGGGVASDPMQCRLVISLTPDPATRLMECRRKYEAAKAKLLTPGGMQGVYDAGCRNMDGEGGGADGADSPPSSSDPNNASVDEAVEKGKENEKATGTKTDQARKTVQDVAKSGAYKPDSEVPSLDVQKELAKNVRIAAVGDAGDVAAICGPGKGACEISEWDGSKWNHVIVISNDTARGLDTIGENGKRATAEEVLAHEFGHALMNEVLGTNADPSKRSEIHDYIYYASKTYANGKKGRPNPDGASAACSAWEQIRKDYLNCIFPEQEDPRRTNVLSGGVGPGGRPLAPVINPGPEGTLGPPKPLFVGDCSGAHLPTPSDCEKLAYCPGDDLNCCRTSSGFIAPGAPQWQCQVTECPEDTTLDRVNCVCVRYGGDGGIPPGGRPGGPDPL